MIMTKKLLLLLLAVSFGSYSQNNYLDFDGTNDVVDTPIGTATMLANATSLTLSCKVYPTRITSGFPDFNGIAGYRNEINFDFYLIQLSSTDLEARFRNSAGTAFSITYTGLTLNQWQQYFLVYNGSTLKLYKGTAEVGSVPASGTVPATVAGNLSIGRITYQAYNWFHKGYIDEVSVWNKALLPTDITSIVANSGEIANPAGETNLKAYYKFNQGIAYGNNLGLTTLNNELGTNNGTLLNFALTGNSSNWGGQPLGVPMFDESHISIYPNPAHDFISIGGLTHDSEVQIYDIAGRIISRKTIQPEEKIDVSNLNSGIYFANINHAQKIKFIRE
jgi:hypothetical protein